ncbi:MAG: CgeB family protein [Janthinobacterium lividum]
MRIFYASDTTPNAALDSNIWRNNLYLPLVDLGHDVVEFDFDLSETFRHLDTGAPANQAFIARNRPLVTAELLRQVRAAHAARPITLFFSYFYDACILPEAIDEIKAMGIVTVNWYCNGSYQLHLVREISAHYDWCLVPEKFRLKDYEAMGAHPLYCQEAANPDIYKPFDVAQEFDAVFVGQAYGERPAAIKFLHDSGIDVRVWGPGWRNFGPVSPLRRAVRWGRRTLQGGSVPVTMPEVILGDPLSDEAMVKMYNRAKINLGFSSCGETHLGENRVLQVRLRDFEVPMSGGFYMVEYMEELEEFYEIGKEIICYQDMNDLAHKIKYYLAHDDEREQIRQAGRTRCLRDHTWQKRFTTAFSEMGLA